MSSSLSTAVLTSTSKPTGERNKQLSEVIDQTNELRIITSASRSMYDQIQAQIEENEPKMAACSNEKFLDYYISQNNCLREQQSLLLRQPVESGVFAKDMTEKLIELSADINHAVRSFTIIPLLEAYVMGRKRKDNGELFEGTSLDLKNNFGNTLTRTIRYPLYDHAKMAIYAEIHLRANQGCFRTPTVKTDDNTLLMNAILQDVSKVWREKNWPQKAPKICLQDTDNKDENLAWSSECPELFQTTKSNSLKMEDISSSINIANCLRHSSANTSLNESASMDLIGFIKKSSDNDVISVIESTGFTL
ncbi:unnamed protein product, partial [Didymodactylos carnosus]